MNSNVEELKQKIEYDVEYNHNLRKNLSPHWDQYTNKTKRNKRKCKISKASRKRNRHV